MPDKKHITINIIFYTISSEQYKEFNCFDQIMYVAISKLVSVKAGDQIFEHVDIQDTKTGKIYGIRRGGKFYRASRDKHPEECVIKKISVDQDQYMNLIYFLEQEWKKKIEYNNTGFYWNFMPWVQWLPHYFMHDSKSKSYFCSQLVAEAFDRSRIMTFKTDHNMISPNKLYTEINDNCSD